MSLRTLRKLTYAAITTALAIGALDCSRARHPTAPAEARFGTLEVESSPPGAAIVVDGSAMDAVTPDDFTLEAGNHTVAVALPGHVFVPASTTLAVPADGFLRFAFVEYAPWLMPDALQHDFPSQDLDTASPAWCLAVTNRGNAAADSVDLALAGSGADQFAIVSGARIRGLAPGGTHDVCVSFRPTRASQHVASLDIGSNVVHLGGTGHKVPCRLTPGQSNHDFGVQRVGTPYAAWCFDVANDDVALCRDTLALTGAGAPEFAIVSGAVFDLAPGASQQVCVEFRPSMAGLSRAQLAVGTGTVTLEGTGEGECRIEPPRAPDGTDFGTVCLAAPATKRLVVANSGNLPCPVTVAGCAPFTVSPPAAIVPPRDSMSFAVTFRPGSVGPAPACAVTLSDDANSWTTTFAGSGRSQPLADFSPSGGIAGHAGEAIVFTAQVQPNGGSSVSYLWDFGDGTTSTQAQPTHRFARGGTYAVTLVVTNECGPSPIAMHSLCVDEPAYVLLYNFREGPVPDFVTNVPGWGTTTPMVLYRGGNAGVDNCPEVVCMNVTRGEIMRTGRDSFSVPHGASEALGTSGQSFSTASLPVPGTECMTNVTLSLGAPTSQPSGPTAYVTLGQCNPVLIGQVRGNSLVCLTHSGTSHCAFPGGDNRIEWGLRAQTASQWVCVVEVRIEFGCWYVCPQGGPQRGRLAVVDAPRK